MSTLTVSIHTADEARPFVRHLIQAVIAADNGFNIFAAECFDELVSEVNRGIINAAVHGDADPSLLHKAFEYAVEDLKDGSF